MIYNDVRVLIAGVELPYMSVSYSQTMARVMIARDLLDNETFASIPQYESIPMQVLVADTDGKNRGDLQSYVIHFDGRITALSHSRQKTSSASVLAFEAVSTLQYTLQSITYKYVSAGRIFSKDVRQQSIDAKFNAVGSNAAEGSDVIAPAGDASTFRLFVYKKMGASILTVTRPSDIFNFMLTNMTSPINKQPEIEKFASQYDTAMNALEDKANIYCTPDSLVSLDQDVSDLYVADSQESTPDNDSDNGMFSAKLSVAAVADELYSHNNPSSDVVEFFVEVMSPNLSKYSDASLKDFSLSSVPIMLMTHPQILWNAASIGAQSTKNKYLTEFKIKNSDIKASSVKGKLGSLLTNDDEYEHKIFVTRIFNIINTLRSMVGSSTVTALVSLTAKLSRSTLEFSNKSRSGNTLGTPAVSMSCVPVSVITEEMAALLGNSPAKPTGGSDVIKKIYTTLLKEIEEMGESIVDSYLVVVKALDLYDFEALQAALTYLTGTVVNFDLSDSRYLPERARKYGKYPRTTPESTNKNGELKYIPLGTLASTTTQAIAEVIKASEKKVLSDNETKLVISSIVDLDLNAASKVPDAKIKAYPSINALLNIGGVELAKTIRGAVNACVNSCEAVVTGSIKTYDSVKMVKGSKTILFSRTVLEVANSALARKNIYDKRDKDNIDIVGLAGKGMDTVQNLVKSRLGFVQAAMANSVTSFAKITRYDLINARKLDIINALSRIDSPYTSKVFIPEGVTDLLRTPIFPSAKFLHQSTVLSFIKNSIKGKKGVLQTSIYKSLESIYANIGYLLVNQLNKPKYESSKLYATEKTHRIESDGVKTLEIAVLPKYTYYAPPKCNVFYDPDFVTAMQHQLASNNSILTFSVSLKRLGIDSSQVPASVYAMDLTQGDFTLNKITSTKIANTSAAPVTTDVSLPEDRVFELSGITPIDMTTTVEDKIKLAATDTPVASIDKEETPFSVSDISGAGMFNVFLGDVLYERATGGKAKFVSKITFKLAIDAADGESIIYANIMTPKDHAGVTKKPGDAPSEPLSLVSMFSDDVIGNMKGVPKPEDAIVSSSDSALSVEVALGHNSTSSFFKSVRPTDLASVYEVDPKSPRDSESLTAEVAVKFVAPPVKYLKALCLKHVDSVVDGKKKLLFIDKFADVKTGLYSFNDRVVTAQVASSPRVASSSLISSGISFMVADHMRVALSAVVGAIVGKTKGASADPNAVLSALTRFKDELTKAVRAGINGASLEGVVDDNGNLTVSISGLEYNVVAGDEYSGRILKVMKAISTVSVVVAGYKSYANYLSSKVMPYMQLRNGLSEAFASPLKYRSVVMPDKFREGHETTTAQIHKKEYAQKRAMYMYVLGVTEAVGTKIIEKMWAMSKVTFLASATSYYDIKGARTGALRPIATRRLSGGICYSATTGDMTISSILVNSARSKPLDKPNYSDVSTNVSKAAGITATDVYSINLSGIEDKFGSISLTPLVNVGYALTHITEDAKFLLTAVRNPVKGDEATLDRAKFPLLAILLNDPYTSPKATIMDKEFYNDIILQSYRKGIDNALRRAQSSPLYQEITGVFTNKYIRELLVSQQDEDQSTKDDKPNQKVTAMPQRTGTCKRAAVNPICNSFCMRPASGAFKGIAYEEPRNAGKIRKFGHQRSAHLHSGLDVLPGRNKKVNKMYAEPGNLSVVRDALVGGVSSAGSADEYKKVVDKAVTNNLLYATAPEDGFVKGAFGVVTGMATFFTPKEYGVNGGGRFVIEYHHCPVFNCFIQYEWGKKIKELYNTKLSDMLKTRVKEMKKEPPAATYLANSLQYLGSINKKTHKNMKAFTKRADIMKEIQDMIDTCKDFTGIANVTDSIKTASDVFGLTVEHLYFIFGRTSALYTKIKGGKDNPGPDPKGAYSRPLILARLGAITKASNFFKLTKGRSIRSEVWDLKMLPTVEVKKGDIIAIMGRAGSVSGKLGFGSGLHFHVNTIKLNRTAINMVTSRSGLAKSVKTNTIHKRYNYLVDNKPLTLATADKTIGFVHSKVTGGGSTATLKDAWIGGSNVFVDPTPYVYDMAAQLQFLQGPVAGTPSEDGPTAQSEVVPESAPEAASVQQTSTTSMEGQGPTATTAPVVKISDVLPYIEHEAYLNVINRRHTISLPSINLPYANQNSMCGMPAALVTAEDIYLSSVTGIDVSATAAGAVSSKVGLNPGASARALFVMMRGLIVRELSVLLEDDDLTMADVADWKKMKDHAGHLKTAFETMHDRPMIAPQRSDLPLVFGSVKTQTEDYENMFGQPSFAFNWTDHFKIVVYLKDVNLAYSISTKDMIDYLSNSSEGEHTEDLIAGYLERVFSQNSANEILDPSSGVVVITPPTESKEYGDTKGERDQLLHYGAWNDANRLRVRDVGGKNHILYHKNTVSSTGNNMLRVLAYTSIGKTSAVVLPQDFKSVSLFTSKELTFYDWASILLTRKKG